MPKNKTFTISVDEILKNHSDTRSNSRQAVNDLLKSLPSPVQSSAKNRFQNHQSYQSNVLLLVVTSALSLLLIGLLAVYFLQLNK